MSEIQTELSVLLIFELTAAETTPPSRTVTLAGGRSSGTSAVPQTADDFGAPRKSAAVGQEKTFARARQATSSIFSRPSNRDTLGQSR
jgi:hypothetical protein